MSILKMPMVLGVLLLGFSAQSHSDLLTHLKQDASHIFPWKKRASDLIKNGVPRYSFEWENDLFGNTDKNYTNGLFMGYTWEPKGFWLQRESHLEEMDCTKAAVGDTLLCKLKDNESAKAEDLKRLTGTLYLQQLMYTPQDLNLPPAQSSLYERPYAGWVSLGWRVRETNALGDYEQYDIALGCVGGCSMAEQFQKWAHGGGWASGDDPQGWSTQIEGGPALQGEYQWSLDPLINPLKRSHRIGSLYADVQVGQVFNRVGLGLHLDITRQNSTQNLKLSELGTVNFPPDRGIGSGPKMVRPVSPSTKSLPPVEFKLEEQSPWDIYFDSAVHYVLHNSLIEGMPFRDNSDIPTRSARPLTWSNTLGVSVDVGRKCTLGFEYQTRSTEVKGVPFKWFDHKWGRLIVNAEDRKFLGVPLTLAFFLALDSI
ncbi:MAG: DUF2219 family protein [Candidatus Sedimenticola sp. (ex Thyasira tokunagai)]